MLPEQIAYVTILAGIIGASFYIKDVWKGTTKPNFVSWFFWMLAPFIGTFLQIQAGAGLSVLPVFMAGFVPFLVLIAALLKQNAYWKITAFDIACGTFSAVALAFWIFTRNTDISLVFAILADVWAAVPTIVKAWKFPETETGAGYMPGVFNNILGLLVIREWTFSITSFGIYFILMNSIILFSIYRKKLFSPQIVPMQ
jgi:hypothetical protein